MSFSITDWNISPNQDWYVKLSDAGDDIFVELYTTQADAEAGTSLTAYGSTDFGTDSDVVLVMDDVGSPEISLFDAGSTYHLKVSGQDADETKIYHVSPFVDLPGITHGIYQSEGMIAPRASYEINAHTHTSKIKSIGIANHIPGLKTGDVLRIQSDHIGIDVLSTITELTISGTPDILVNTVETIEYVDLSRE
jgi:hypothetical protein